ncbi:NUDIX domain-containing protein [Candidatus Parcubacteria bacterium]|nr:MAG: NUDIX domain-containing protein [Candidatus Parcubacteria bacterium]
MPVERSAGLILFNEAREGRRYLVLHSTPSPEYPDFWDFSKGVLDGNEKGVEAARREAQEETGITDLDIIEGFKYTARYFRKNRNGKGIIPKFVAMFLARTDKKEVKLSWEHDKFEWLTYEEALNRISNKEIKKSLEAAEDFLNKNDI